MEDLKELMTNAVHEFIDNDQDHDRHISQRIVRRITPQHNGVMVEEVHIARIPIGDLQW